jgi:hypothetical protein
MCVITRLKNKLIIYKINMLQDICYCDSDNLVYGLIISYKYYDANIIAMDENFVKMVRKTHQTFFEEFFIYSTKYIIKICKI